MPDNEIHMLGYFIDMDDAGFQDLLREFRAGREDRGRKMVERLADLGLEITWAEVERIADGAAVGRPHIAQAMIERGYVSVWQEPSDKYIGRTGPAYVDAPGWSLRTPSGCCWTTERCPSWRTRCTMSGRIPKSSETSLQV